MYLRNRSFRIRRCVAVWVPLWEVGLMAGGGGGLTGPLDPRALVGERDE